MIWYDEFATNLRKFLSPQKILSRWRTTMPSVSSLDTINQVSGDGKGRINRKNGETVSSEGWSIMEYPVQIVERTWKNCDLWRICDIKQVGLAVVGISLWVFSSLWSCCAPSLALGEKKHGWIPIRPAYLTSRSGKHGCIYIYMTIQWLWGELRISVYQYSNIFHIQWAAKELLRVFPSRMIDSILC